MDFDDLDQEEEEAQKVADEKRAAEKAVLTAARKEAGVCLILSE